MSPVANNAMIEGSGTGTVRKLAVSPDIDCAVPPDAGVPAAGDTAARLELHH